MPKLALGARRLEDFAQIGDAGLDRRELLEMEIGLLGEEPRHRGLAGARRAPEDHRAEPAGLDHAAQHALLAEEMVLADDLGQRRRAQAIGERPRRAVGKPGSFEQRGGFLHGSALNGEIVHPPLALEGEAPAAGEAPSAFTRPATDVTLSLLSPITRSPRFTPNLDAGVFG